MITPLGRSLRTDTVNRTDPTSQPTIFHLKQEAGTGHNDQNHSPIGSLNSCIDVPRSGWNIDNRTVIKPQGPIMTTITESNRANNCEIFDLVSKTLDLAYRDSPWYGTIKNESENLVENLRGKKISKSLRAIIILKLKKLGVGILQIGITRT